MGEKFEFVAGGLCAPKGFRASGVHCGIRKNKEKKDLALVVSDVLCSAAAIYTQNKVKGAPILVTKKNLQNGKAQAVIANSGNANTCNADGEEKAQMMCDLCAEATGVCANDVIVASTGVIGQVLPIEPIQNAMPALVGALTGENSLDASEAILTTDTRRKEYAVAFSLGGKPCVVAGMAKGSGMIHPNMATMLCFLTTDAAIEPALLQKALKEVSDDTFNMVSVDGDTSTNDMVSILASGLAGNEPIAQEGEDYKAFCQALYILLEKLSKDIAGDGEGATRLLECVVTGAVDKKNAKVIAKSVITSSLFKAAMFGADANWGRVLCAIGYAEADLDITKVAVSFESRAGHIDVCKSGAGIAFSEDDAKKILLEDEIRILIALGDGDASATAWGCDLTYDYVKINGDYRT